MGYQTIIPTYTIHVSVMGDGLEDFASSRFLDLANASQLLQYSFTIQEIEPNWIGF